MVWACVMCDGLAEAISRVTVTGAVGRSFTAHPKLDPATSGWHGFCYETAFSVTIAMLILRFCNHRFSSI
jgi:carotenoid cleavage dioxygenase-like enzyme